MASNIRMNDVVEVIAGDHRGARGKVLRIDLRKQKVVVEGINLVFRHVRPTRKNPQGGRVQKEAAIHVSNVLPYDPALGKGKRTRFVVKRDAKGKIASKQRVSVAGNALHSITRADRSAG